jgi:hypothetical protein
MSGRMLISGRDDYLFVNMGGKPTRQWAAITIRQWAATTVRQWDGNDAYERNSLIIYMSIKVKNKISHCELRVASLFSCWSRLFQSGKNRDKERNSIRMGVAFLFSYWSRFFESGEGLIRRKEFLVK